MSIPLNNEALITNIAKRRIPVDNKTEWIALGIILIGIPALWAMIYYNRLKYYENILLTMPQTEHSPRSLV